jgi:hypothetical protein
MFAFLGLRYEPGVLAGLSLHQQRIGRWRRYAEPLSAMCDRLLETEARREAES